MTISNCLNKALLLIAVIVFLGFPIAVSASEYAPPDPETAAQKPVPEHDTEATLRGKSAIEHASSLAAPDMVFRLMALQALIEMGPDALPAREVVRFVAEHGDTAEFSDARIDELRLGALSTLYAMQAPETVDLLRSKIIDPDYLSRDRAYAGLLSAATQVGIDHETLTRDLTSLLDTAPDHAERLMALDALPALVQSALEVVVFEAPHGDVATRHFLGRLSEMTTLDDTARIAYVLDNQAVAGSDPSQSRDMLAAIGTEPALDAALAIAPLEGPRRYNLIASFADGPMPLEHVTARLMQEMDTVAGGQEIGQVVSILERMLRDDGTLLFSDAMSRLITAGPTPAHRAVGIQRQVLYLQRNPNADAAAALRPVFALLGDAAAPSEARIAADRALRQSPARLAEMNPDYFIAEASDLIWPAKSPSEADLSLALLLPLMRSAELAPRVVQIIEERFDEHLAQWSINPATAIVIGSGSTRGLDRSATREAAAIMMGKALESPAIDLDYMGSHLGRNGAALASLQNNTVAGVIGTYVPTIFAQDKPESYDFAMEPYLRPMLERPSWLQQDPDAKAEWLAFLQRVIDLDDENFSPTAQRALDRF